MEERVMPGVADGPAGLVEALRRSLLDAAEVKDAGGVVEGWMGPLSTRELRVAAHCVRYVEDGPAGLIGDVLMVLVARLAWILERLDEAGAVVEWVTDEQVEKGEEV